MTSYQLPRTEQEWRVVLSPQEFQVLRQAGTEPAFTGQYTDTMTAGVYRCRACGTELFRSEAKFHSGCGWPSFWSPLAQDRVRYLEDRSGGRVRTEVRCANCDSHLGHVFQGEGFDTPTDLRYCINSICLTLEPDAPASARGNLDWLPLSDNSDLVAEPVAAARHLVPQAEVATIDPELADTAAFCQAYQVSPQASANCVVVEGRRGDRVVHAGVLVLATDRADINKTVRKHLDVRRISFMDQEQAEAITQMRQGGITPVGLPDDWRILVDQAVAEAGPVVIGAGVRGAKLLVDGADLAGLPNAEQLALTLPRE